MMTGYLLSFHSIVDVITNSSTEIYTIDQKQEVEIVRDIIKEFEKTLNMTGYRSVSVYVPDSYEISDIFGIYYDDEQVINYLRAKGYVVEGDPSNPPKSSFIRISCERGYMHPDIKKFIEETFNVTDYSS